ncbi:MAG TPA: alpha-hydroxy-acid oxidizing protein [Chloroflexota bacterium]|nr:alpha-hydroxy-acid oxidizing protein [Chloroflexota bacterium]
MTDLKDLPTLGSIERKAKEVLHPAVWAFGYYGSYSGQTFDRNRRALDQLAIEQRVVVDVRNIDTSVQFFGQTLPSPIVVCPMGAMVDY